MTDTASFPNAWNTLFIFGNGFDLDLGFPTGYKDYYLSDHFPFVHNDQSCHSLGHFLYDKGEKEKWYDLENLLAEYGMTVRYESEKDIQGDNEDYQQLVQGLANYLNSIEYRHPREDSMAANLLRAANYALVPPTVYTFNYTDFQMMSATLGATYTNVHHVHGCLRDNDIVLGVGEYVKLQQGASFLYKTSDLGYNARGILNAFDTYDNIIIFGLSMSQVDYPYFEDFFRDLASRKYMGEERKYIRIFTYDEKSRLEILDNLRGMNSGLIKLIGYSDFDIIRTKDDIDILKEQEVVAHLNVH